MENILKIDINLSMYLMILYNIEIWCKVFRSEIGNYNVFYSFEKGVFFSNKSIIYLVVFWLIVILS